MQAEAKVNDLLFSTTIASMDLLQILADPYID